MEPLLPTSLMWPCCNLPFLLNMMYVLLDFTLDMVIPLLNLSPFNLSIRSRICIPKVSLKLDSALITSIFRLGFRRINHTVYAIVINELLLC